MRVRRRSGKSLCSYHRSHRSRRRRHRTRCRRLWCGTTRVTQAAITARASSSLEVNCYTRLHQLRTLHTLHPLHGDRRASPSRRHECTRNPRPHHHVTCHPCHLAPVTRQPTALPPMHSSGKPTSGPPLPPFKLPQLSPKRRPPAADAAGHRANLATSHSEPLLARTFLSKPPKPPAHEPPLDVSIDLKPPKSPHDISLDLVPSHARRAPPAMPAGFSSVALRPPAALNGRETAGHVTAPHGELRHGELRHASGATSGVACGSAAPDRIGSPALPPRSATVVAAEPPSAPLTLSVPVVRGRERCQVRHRLQHSPRLPSPLDDVSFWQVSPLDDVSFWQVAPLDDVSFWQVLLAMMAPFGQSRATPTRHMATPPSLPRGHPITRPPATDRLKYVTVHTSSSPIT